MTSVCPALWPPWKRTTTSARALSQSTILPLPSSPHWAPMTATFAIRFDSLEYPGVYPCLVTGRHTAVSQRASEGQRADLLNQRQSPDFGQHLVGHALVHLKQRNGIRPGRRTPEIEVRDIHPRVPQKRAQPADEARLVLVGDVEHVRMPLRCF